MDLYWIFPALVVVPIILGFTYLAIANIVHIPRDRQELNNDRNNIEKEKRLLEWEKAKQQRKLSECLLEIDQVQKEKEELEKKLQQSREMLEPILRPQIKMELQRELMQERWRIQKEKDELQRAKDIQTEMYEKRKKRLEQEQKEIEYKKADLEQYAEKTIIRVDEYIKAKCKGYPFLAGMIADLSTLHFEKSAHFLESKSRPALEEAKRLRDLRTETRSIIAEKKEIEYKLAYIEKLFPNISDIFDSGFEEDAFVLETEENKDRVKNFLSAEEYVNMTESERNQLALDRYIENRKTKWQIGRDYEMYIGFCAEKKGYSVKYTGMIQKFEDMGRDLIATKGNSTHIIQCKNWSQEKTIHEKHIFQLYGTVVLYKIEHPINTVKGVFVTSTELSETAKAVARELGIVVKEKIIIKEYPRIKCNINKTTGAKIYHLPFDQQYDTAVIESGQGESYAFTVKEAEAKGFRRAFKHFS